MASGGKRGEGGNGAERHLTQRRKDAEAQRKEKALGFRRWAGKAGILNREIPEICKRSRFFAGGR